MKKFVASMILFLAFAFSANAQEQKMNAEEKAKVEAYELSESLGLKGAQQDDFIMLLVLKARTSGDTKLSTERKSEMARIVDERLRSTLTADQLAKLKDHPHLLQTSAPPAVKATR